MRGFVRVVWTSCGGVLDDLVLVSDLKNEIAKQLNEKIENIIFMLEILD